LFGCGVVIIVKAITIENVGYSIPHLEECSDYLMSLYHAILGLISRRVLDLFCLI
jgi:hypothetical protein